MPAKTVSEIKAKNKEASTEKSSPSKVKKPTRQKVSVVASPAEKSLFSRISKVLRFLASDPKSVEKINKIAKNIAKRQGLNTNFAKKPHELSFKKIARYHMTKFLMSYLGTVVEKTWSIPRSISKNESITSGKVFAATGLLHRKGFGYLYQKEADLKSEWSVYEEAKRQKRLNKVKKSKKSLKD